MFLLCNNFAGCFEGENEGEKGTRLIVQVLSLNSWLFHWIISNYGNYVLLCANDGSSSFSIGETFCKQINEG